MRIGSNVTTKGRFRFHGSFKSKKKAVKKERKTKDAFILETKNGRFAVVTKK